MNLEQWLEIIRVSILALSGIAIPYVIFVVGNRLTKVRQLEESLREDRIEIYNKILEPFLLIFTPQKVIAASAKYKKDKDKTGVELAAEKLLTIEYQDYAFKLNLIGSDDVVRAYNNLMQANFNLEGEDKGQKLIYYMAVLLLEVRKSFGNEATKLDALEMLEWKITDLRKFKSKSNYPNMDEYYHQTNYHTES